jgi:hypothetical protein
MPRGYAPVPDVCADIAEESPARPRVTVKVNAWVAVPYLFLAVRVSGYTPAAALLGVPEIVAVPFV